MKKASVLMIGPGRDVMGGISTVVNNYYSCGLDKKVQLLYLPTMEDGSKSKKMMVAVKAYIRFTDLVKKCDIVHVHMAAQASFDRKAFFIRKAHKAGKRIIIHQHAADFDKYFLEQVNEKKRSQIKQIFSLADKVIVLSEEWADFFSKYVCETDRIVIIHNGVIIPKFEKHDYKDHNVLMLGRLGHRKGTYDLLKAIPLIIKTVPDAMFYLGGDGDVEKCRKIVEDKGFINHVVFLGWIQENEKIKYLRKCSTFILPSYEEGMPMAVLEAMSYGLATVSTNAGGIPQIINQNVDGIRVEAGDVKSIVAVLINLLTDVDYKKKLGNAARLKIEEKFDFQTIVKELVKLYGEVLS